MATKVEGMERLRKQFAALPDALRADIRSAMEKGAAEIVAMARRLVPVDSGDLRDSIGWTWGTAPRGSITLASAKGASAGQTLTIYAGNDEAFYARWVEFGTVSQPPQPFFYPSYRANKKRVRGRVNRAIKKAARTVAGSQ